MSDDSASPADVSRRDFVARMSAISAVWIAAACSRENSSPAIDSTQGAMPTMSDAAAPPQTLQHFSPDQAKNIDAIASRIIPTDDAPGAHEAGVLYFIDRSLMTTAKDQVPFFDGGLKDLAKTVAKKHGAATQFAALTPDQQDAILQGIEKTDFFGAMRFATICGFLSLPKYGGNKDFIGWKYIGQEHVFEQKPPFGWYDRPENQQALLGRVIA